LTAGHIESRVQRYMPAVMTDAATDDLSAAVGSMPQTADDATSLNLSSATKRAVLLSRIHSRRFRE